MSAGADTLGEQAPEACDMNLGPRQRKRRLRLGLHAGLLVVLAAAAIILFDAPPLAHLLLAPMITLSLLGFLQYRART